MKKVYILSAILAIGILSGCGDSEFSAQHNQGKNCLECHSFKSGATIFKKADAKNYDEKAVAQGYSVQLKLDNGEIIKFDKGNGLGNFKYSGDTSKIDRFTPQIVDKDGNVVNQSSQNSHDITRLACNSCHTQEGLNGAPGRIVNFDLLHNIVKEQPSDQNSQNQDQNSNAQDQNNGQNQNQNQPPSSLSFSQDIMPILTNNCKQCHGDSGRYRVTDAQSTYNNINSIGMIDTNNPTNSRILRKPTTDGISHGGSHRFDKSDDRYKTILKWIEEGAKNN